MVADGSGEENLVTGSDRSGTDRNPRQSAADSGSGDIHLIGLAVLDHLGVPAHDCDSRSSGCAAHGPNLVLEGVGRQPSLQHERRDEGNRLGSRDRQVIHGAMHRQLADGAAGKPERGYHEAVGRERETGAVDVQLGGISELVGRRRGCSIVEEGNEQPIDQPPGCLTAGAVSHLDLGFTEPDLRSGWVRRGIARQTGAARLTRKAALRCS